MNYLDINIGNLNEIINLNKEIRVAHQVKLN
jgi:hypothetical protein